LAEVFSKLERSRMSRGACRIRGLVAVAAIFLFGAAGGSALGNDWSQFRFSAEDIAFNPETLVTPTKVSALRLRWVGRGPIGPAVVAEGRVYAGGWDGKLHVFAPDCGSGGATCSPLWTVQQART